MLPSLGGSFLLLFYSPYANMLLSLKKKGNTQMTSNKTVPVGAKQKANTNYKQVIHQWIARPVAFGATFILAAYGLRQLLRTLDDSTALVLTVLAIGLLLYTMICKD